MNQNLTKIKPESNQSQTEVEHAHVTRAERINSAQERPHHNDSTASRLLSEVKHCRARLVLRWGTTLESLVLFFVGYVIVWQKAKNRITLHIYPAIIAEIESQ